MNLSELFDSMLGYMDNGETASLPAFGKAVARFREEENLNLEVLLESFDETRQTVAGYISELPQSAEEINESLASLNEFFLEIQRYTWIHAARFRDIEIERKDELLHSLEENRMEILGRISTSFAHEFRNPLTSIKGFVQLLERRIPENIQEKAYIDFIHQEIQGLEENVDQFLMLSNTKNHQDESAGPIMLHHLLLSVTEAFRPICSENDIHLTLEIRDTLVTKGAEDQLRLALMKIVHNAVDALMYVSYERNIFIQAKSEDDHNRIIVENNGPRIPEYLLETIFEPFVSTKELGKGLGLSVCKQVIEKHDGRLNCTSKDGMTVFEVCLPDYSGSTVC
ncbi:ATP-binding protein [Alteribacter natronophilus]|uniref:ATP-binding protein n=1 Tax=Alteribacter natronophilus TaxID=2583810 RepID=UPI0014870280|nr:HAMP domain-containing sensor histidine kinase [Alteribacter natronophilus]